MNKLKSYIFSLIQNNLYKTKETQTMFTEQNIELIKEIFTKKNLSMENHDFSKVFQVTKLKDFYIRPENNSEFHTALTNAVELGKALGNKMFENNNTRYNPKQCVNYAVGYLIILTIKAHMDYSYFLSQIDRARSINPEHKEFLKEQLFSLSKDELYSFMEIVNNYNIDFCFIGEGHLYDMMCEFNSACYAHDPSVQDINDENFTDFFSSTIDLFNEYRGRELEYISEQTFCEILYKYIDGAFYQLGRLAEILHSTGYDAAVEYITNKDIPI